MCIVTVRRLKAGTYEGFRRAWEPDPWPERVTRALHLRNTEHPEEVCSMLFIDASADELEALRDDASFIASEAGRIERIAAFEDDLVLNSVFQVVEEVQKPGA